MVTSCGENLKGVFWDGDVPWRRRDVFGLDNGIDGVDHAVAGDDVEAGDIGGPGGRLDLDEGRPFGGDLLAAGGLEGGAARRDVLALHTKNVVSYKFLYAFNFRFLNLFW